MPPSPANGPPPTAEQQAVIDHQDGNLVVLAAVGSGKTTTLGRRIARALEQGIRPERVLALTFTNRAALHMRESLERVVAPEIAQKVCLSTFHALCSRILRSANEAAGLPSDFRILDEDDAQELLADFDPDGGPRSALFALAEAASQTPLHGCKVDNWHKGVLLDAPWLPKYAQALADRGAVDFAGLVYLTRAVLTEDAGDDGQESEALSQWRTSFDMVQVDEVQDTHLSEYEVLRVLASRARSLCLVGDLDQTIYSWRGSAPHALLKRVEQDFGSMTHLSLTRCFRATRRVLAVADALATGLSNRTSTVEAAATMPAGTLPTLHGFPNNTTERVHIARTAQALIADGVPAEDIAVLVRTNKEIGLLAGTFEAQRVPCTTIEQFRFFRRQDVKDALGLARLVVDRRDEFAARRIAMRLVQGVGARTVQRIVREGRPLGLRLCDLMDTTTVTHGDPLWALGTTDCVVLDTETTGLSAEDDEVIEIGAVRLRGGHYSGAPEDTFSRLILNTQPLGASEAVHHISEAHLQEHGEPAQTVFADLRAFIGNLPIAGHNVAFDQKMLEAHGARVGVPLDLHVIFDTLDAARRLLPSGSHKLGHLLQRLGIEGQNASHRALDDVKATVALAHTLHELAQVHARDRLALITREATAFTRLRTTLDAWCALQERPHVLVRRICTQVLGPRLRNKPDYDVKMAILTDLINRLKQRDEPRLPPGPALAHVLDAVALNREMDALDGTDGVRILTMHQSKGLEFGHVFVPGLHDGGLPAWWVQRSGDEAALQEELRLLYVAVTRARRGLHMSWSARGDRGHPQQPSQFLRHIPPQLIARVDTTAAQS